MRADKRILMRKNWNMSPKALAEKVKNLRKSATLTQEELANKSGVARRVIQNIESAEGSPSMSTLSALGKALGAEFGLTQPIDNGFKDAADFFSRFASAPPHIQKAVLAIVYMDASYLEDESETTIRDTTRLVKTLAAL